MQKQILARSLEKLLMEKPITDITVREIAGNCGLSTRTFYNYFADKFDLMCFYYYTLNEACWYKQGKPRSLASFYRKWITEGAPERRIALNMYAYVGQNDIREFVISKTFSDFYRLFLWAGHPELLKDPTTFDVIVLLVYGFTGTMECSIKSNKALTIDMELRSIPEKQRSVLLTEPNPAVSAVPIQGFHLSEVEWPPKLYDLHPEDL